MDEKAYKHEWYLRHREKIIAKAKRYRIKNSEKIKDAKAVYYKKNKESIKRKNSAYQMDRVSTLRRSLFNLLGGPTCVQCGFTDIRALQFDHKNGGGRKESKEDEVLRSHGRCALYLRYLKDPGRAKATLQILCANCNWIKRHTHNEVRKPLCLTKPI